LLLTVPSRAQAPVEFFAFNGDPAPVPGETAFFGDFFGHEPLINQSGEILFQATIVDESDQLIEPGRRGLFLKSGESIALVARIDIPVPIPDGITMTEDVASGDPQNVTFTSFNDQAVLSDDGSVVFSVSSALEFDGGLKQEFASSGYFYWADGVLEPLLIEGIEVLLENGETGSVGPFTSNFTRSQAAYNQGLFAALGSVVMPAFPFGRAALWGIEPGPGVPVLLAVDLTMDAQELQQLGIPGHPGGIAVRPMRTAVNTGGVVAAYGSEVDVAFDAPDLSIYQFDFAAKGVIPADLILQTFTIFNELPTFDLRIDGDGVVAYSGGFTTDSEALFSQNFQEFGVHRGASGVSVDQVYAFNTLAADFGSETAYYGRPDGIALLDDGRVLFVTEANPQQLDIASDPNAPDTGPTAVWLEDSLRVIEGTQLPSDAGTIRIDELVSVHVNNNGLVVFTCMIEGDGVDQFNDFGIYAVPAAGGNPVKGIREGDVLQFKGIERRVVEIEALNFLSSGSSEPSVHGPGTSGFPRALNDSGEFVFAATFGPTSGIVLADASGMGNVKFGSVFNLTSPAFNKGGPIPAKHTIDGDDVSPKLDWDGVSASKYALIMRDETDGGTVHWLAYDIPGSVMSLPEAIPMDGELSDGTRQGTNDFGNTGYNGPAPPPEEDEHLYSFTVFALSEALGLPAGSTETQVTDALDGKVVAEAKLTGTYERPGDADNDGLPDDLEMELGTDPNDPDTDGDGVTDGVEVFVLESDPLAPDIDDDGLNDSEEESLGTDPNEADTDRDGTDDPDDAEPLAPSDALLKAREDAFQARFGTAGPPPKLDLDVMENDDFEADSIIDSFRNPDKGGQIDTGLPFRKGTDGPPFAIGYTPAQGFEGTETFWYQITNSTGRRSVAPVLVTIDIQLGNINGDEDINAVDVQLVINAVLGLDIGEVVADINANGATNAVDVQLVINAVLGLNIEDQV